MSSCRNSFGLVRVWGNAVCTDDRTKEIEDTLAKLALLLFQGDTDCLESLEGGKKLPLVFLLVLPMDDHVHQAQNTGQVVKDLIHPSLEVLRSAGDTEGHLVKTKAAKQGDESNDMTSPQWEFAKHCWHAACCIPGSCQLCESVIDLGQRVGFREESCVAWF